MGLDTVELIFKIEEHFGLQIPDQEAGQMTTIRHISDYISSHTGADSERMAQIEREVLSIVADHAGVDITELWLDMSITNDLGLD
jgi:acyl carrier protein